MADMSIEVLEDDTSSPGVFVVATKPDSFEETSLTDHQLFSIVTGRRCRSVSNRQLRWFLWVKRPVTRFLPEAAAFDTKETAWREVIRTRIQRTNRG